MPETPPKRVAPFAPKLQPACRALSAGGVIAYPTEAVWGLGCDPNDATAVQKLLDLKRRDWRKGLILIAADFSQLAAFVKPLDAGVLKPALDTWPGPYTWLLPAATTAPARVTGGGARIAVRVTAHPVAAALCRAWGGALVSTSANRSGEAPALTALRVRRRFGATLDALVPGALGGLATPTAIRDLISGAVIRV